MVVSVIGGTGSQGLGIAKRLAVAGESVIVGSRKEEKALKIVEETLEELNENPEQIMFSKVYIPYFTGLARKLTDFDKKIEELNL